MSTANISRIAFATPEYVTENYFDGGLANYIYRLARALVDLNHDVHVVTLSEIDRSEFQHQGVNVHRILTSKAWHTINRLTRYRLTSTTHLLDFSFQVYRKLKMINSQRPLHLVQFPNSSYCGLASMCFLKVPQLMRASSFQRLLNESTGLQRTMDLVAQEKLEALTFRLCRHVFAPSLTLRQTLLEHAPVTQIEVIRTPIYLENNDWDASVYDQWLRDKNYLLFFGRFEINKGFHTLVQALPEFFEQQPDAYAAMVGRDMRTPLGPSMIDYARQQLGRFTDRVVFIDKVHHAQLYPIISGARLVVLPSLMDNLPNACLESMALGKVVIGTLGASFDEVIVDGENGFLVKAGDPEHLAEKICQVWANPALDEIGRAAKDKAQEFSPEQTIPALLNYYETVIQEFE